MTNSEDKTEWIDQYLDGHLTATELVVFERKMSREPDFKLEVEAQKAVRKTLEECGAKKTFLAARPTDEPIPDEKGVRFVFPVLKKRSWKSNTFTLAIIAFMVLVLSNAIFLLYQRKPERKETLPEKVPAKIFHVPVIESSQSGSGFLNRHFPVDSVAVQILVSGQNADNYQFKDTLKLYLENTTVDHVRLQYNSQTNFYLLFLRGERYQLERGFTNINPLQSYSFE